MNQNVLSCPYCNSHVATPPGARSGQRVSCPRCGESFAYRTSGAEVAVTEPVVEQPAIPSDEALPARWSNRRLATVVLGGMATMAALGLAFALATTQIRRSHDRVGSADPQRAIPIKTVAPAELEGLGYLPPDTDVILGVHVAELLQEPAGRQLLPWVFTAWPSLSPVNLEKWTGLRLEDVDHAILAAEVQKTLLPRLYLIVQTKTPLDWEQHLRSKLKATRHPEAGNKPWYRIHIEQPPLEPVLWPLNDHTLVACLNIADFKKLRAEQPFGAEHLSPALQGLLKERLGNAAPLWLAGHLDDWDQPLLQLLLADVSPESRSALRAVRSMAAWASTGGGSDAITFNAAIECADVISADKAAAYIAKLTGNVPDLEKRFGSRNSGAEVARAFAANFKGVVNEKWVTAQTRVDGSALRAVE